MQHVPQEGDFFRTQAKGQFVKIAHEVSLSF